MHYILFYNLVDDYLGRRGPLREEHLKLARIAYEHGEIVLAGALADPADMAVLIFRSERAAEQFAKGDPYVLKGLVSSWRVRKWSTVIGVDTSAT